VKEADGKAKKTKGKEDIGKSQESKMKVRA